MQVTVRRTMLVREIEEYVLDLPDTADPHAMLFDDFGEFDELLIGQGECTSPAVYEGIDDDNLSLTILSPEAPKTSQERASSIEVGWAIREYGELDYGWHAVTSLTDHGDRVLVTYEDGGEPSFDRDESIERRL